MSDLTEAVAQLADKSLLVMDDDSALRIRLGRALESRGFEPTLASSVAEAVAAVKAKPPAFAGMSGEMPYRGARLARMRCRVRRCMFRRRAVSDTLCPHSS